jgi:hypothetical protein
VWAVTVQIAVLCVVTPCSLADAYRRCSLEVLLVYQTDSVMSEKTEIFKQLINICRGHKFLKKSWSHLKILGSGRLRIYKCWLPPCTLRARDFCAPARVPVTSRTVQIRAVNVSSCRLFYMGVKLGRSHSGRNVAEGFRK